MRKVLFSLPHVKGGAFESRSESLGCCRLSVGDGEVALGPVYVLHNGSQVLVHVVHGQHRHLSEAGTEFKSHSEHSCWSYQGKGLEKKT